MRRIPRTCSTAAPSTSTGCHHGGGEGGGCGCCRVPPAGSAIDPETAESRSRFARPARTARTSPPGPLSSPQRAQPSFRPAAVGVLSVQTRSWAFLPSSSLWTYPGTSPRACAGPHRRRRKSPPARAFLAARNRRVSRRASGSRPSFCRSARAATRIRLSAPR